VSWARELAALRAWVETELARRFAIQWGWTRTAKTSATGERDTVVTADGAKGQRPVRRLEAWGFRGRPPQGVRSFWIRMGSSNVVIVGLAPGKAYGPSDLEDGETAVYNITRALVRLWKSGKLTVDAEDGEDVVVNGGTLPVARKDDPVRGGTWNFFNNTGTGNLDVKFTEPGSVTPLFTFHIPGGTVDGGNGDHVVTLSIQDGAARFKG